MEVRSRRVLVAALVVAVVCATSIDQEDMVTSAGRGSLSTATGRDQAITMVQEETEPDSPDDQIAKTDDAQENQAEEAEEEEDPKQDDEDAPAEQKAADEPDDAQSPQPDAQEDTEEEPETEPQDSPQTESTEQIETEQAQDQPKEADTPDAEPTESEDDNHPAQEQSEEPEEPEEPVEEDEKEKKPDWAKDFTKQMSPEEARQKIEEYAQKAEIAIRSAPEEKRQALAGTIARDMAKKALYDSEKIRDDTERRKTKRDFKKDGAIQKLAKLELKTVKFQEKQKEMAEAMNKTWSDEQQDMARVKTDAKDEQIAIVEHKHKKYLEWKAARQLVVSKQIGIYDKETKSMQSKTATETARYNELNGKLKKKQAQLKQEAADERKHKEEAVVVKEARVKSKEKLQKTDKKMSDEMTNEKVIKKTSEAKEKKEGKIDSAQTTKAEDQLAKVNTKLDFLNKDLATEVTEASEEALRAQRLMLKERTIAENRTETNETDTNTTIELPEVAPLKKKCGPGVPCELYNKVVAKVGGSDKYFKVEMEELSKIKGDGEPTPEMERQSFDAIAERFGVTGEGTEGKVCGPGVPCDVYNKVMKEAGGSGKLMAEEAAEVERILKLQNDQIKKEEGPAAKMVEATDEIKKQAFDKIADKYGVKPSPGLVLALDF